MWRTSTIGVDQNPKEPLKGSISKRLIEPFFLTTELRIAMTRTVERNHTILVAAVSAAVSTLICIGLTCSNVAFGPQSTLLFTGNNVLIMPNITVEKVNVALSNLNTAEAKFQAHLIQREEIRKNIDCRKVKWPCEWTCGLQLFHMTYLSPVYPCYHEYHLGTWGEGGKWVCDIPGAVPRSKGIVYSIGSKAQVGFEKAIYEAFNISSFTFDPTLSEEQIKFMKLLDFVHFSEFGLTGEDDLQRALNTLKKNVAVSPHSKMMKLDGIMSTLNHSFIDILKVDCERCEESFIKDLPSIAKRNSPLFGQLFIEFHRLNDTGISLPLMEILEDLGYRPFHAEPNFYFIGHNWELAFIHESLVLPKEK